ncbi:MAG: hypothetical protein M3Y54_06395 [Bacteroidota bacterium]|nr:hypothetical protein [Bacteroidota bacterium]
MLLLLVAMGLSSCIGVSLIAGTRQRPVGKTLGPLVGDDGLYKGGVTTADALRLWGEPRRKEVVGLQQHWRYRVDELAWRGAQVWLIVPVPLLLPVGHKHVTLTFEGDHLQAYTMDDARERFFGYFIQTSGPKVWLFNDEGTRGENDPDCYGYYGCY